MILIDLHHTFNLALSQHLRIDWFPNSIILQGASALEHELVRSSSQKKVIIIEFQPWHTDTYDLSWADLLIFFTPEAIYQGLYHGLEEQIIKQYNSDRYIFIAGGTECGDMGEKFYVKNPETFAKVVCANLPMSFDYSNKTKLFDALLGVPKTFRIEIFNKIKKHNLLDCSLVNIMQLDEQWSGNLYGPYFPDTAQFENYTSPELIPLEASDLADIRTPTTFCSPQLLRHKGMKSIQELNQAYGLDLQWNETVDNIDQYPPMASQLLPDQIYNASWYSIVSETYVGGPIFTTEKTAKCFLGKRIFVMFGSQYVLADLREQGFKTFNNILDESYDELKFIEPRVEAAWEQVLYLSKQDPADLYRRAADILEHNYHHLINLRRPMEQLKEFIFGHLSRL